MAEDYILQVTAGPSYDLETHRIVAVNTADPLSISSDLMDIELNVRIQNYRGLPLHSPATSPYFASGPHAANSDQYSIAFAFTPKRSIGADALVFGNDFDQPIRDRLPPGFGTAFKIVRWAVDPGLDGDVYADRPYLYGPLASSLNVLRVGPKAGDAGGRVKRGEAGLVIDEGGQGEGLAWRRGCGVPDVGPLRRKWFLNEANRAAWEWEAGRQYWGDFFNAYLNFNDFALNLPGFNLPIMQYWDGQSLRYVLKDRKTGEVGLVVRFTLYLKEDVDEAGNIRAGVVGSRPKGAEKEGAEAKDDGAVETNAEDVD